MIAPLQFRLPDELTDLLVQAVAASESDLEDEVRILLHQASHRARKLHYI